MDPAKIKFDDFVNNVIDSSKDPQQKIVLSGYVGKSPNQGSIRIYADISLSNYCEVKSDDIIHQQPLPAQTSQLGGSIIWVKADAKISTGNDAYHYDAQNNYFKGDIANAYRGAAGVNAMLNQGLPTSGVKSVCTDCVQPAGLPTTSGVRSICTDCVQQMGLPTTSGVRSICTDCVQQMGLPTTSGVRSICTDCVQQMGLPTTSGVRSICTDCVQVGVGTVPTTTYACRVLPTTTVKGICTDMAQQQNVNNVSQYCGTGNYNPYM